MIRSMTGFGSKEGKILPWGKAYLELRSTNHKSQEIVFRLPEAFLSLEEKIKKEIEKKISRGRVLCALSVLGTPPNQVFINRSLLKNYLCNLKNIKKQLHIQGEVQLDSLLQLPGVVSLPTLRMPPEKTWAQLKHIINQALNNLVEMRQREGQALYKFLRYRMENLKSDVAIVQSRFKKVVKDKVSKIETIEERSSFLKETDIAEELERLTFHLKNFMHKILRPGPMGKELDFIAQEMQREANTISAKVSDALISAKVVEIKSEIEKVREQLQNIE